MQLVFQTGFVGAFSACKVFSLSLFFCAFGALPLAALLASEYVATLAFRAYYGNWRYVAKRGAKRGAKRRAVRTPVRATIWTYEHLLRFWRCLDF